MNNFTLSRGKNKKSFNLQYSFSCIMIEKIMVIINDSDNLKWFNTILKYNPYLFFEYKDNQGTTYSYPLIISSLISANQRSPIFDFMGEEIMVVPYENQRNLTSLGRFVTFLSIELKFYYEHPDEIEDFSLLIYYNDTPGVTSSQKS